MLSPASARISAVTPPPAPVPTITASASSVRGFTSVAASITCQPLAMPIRIGSINGVRVDSSGIGTLGEHRRAVVSERAPCTRIAIPGRENELMQSVVRRAQERNAATAKPRQKCIDIACRRLAPGARRPHERPTYRGKREQCEQLADLAYLKRRQAVNRSIDIHDRLVDRLVTLRRVLRQCASQYGRDNRAHDR